MKLNIPRLQPTDTLTAINSIGKLKQYCEWFGFELNILKNLAMQLSEVLSSSDFLSVILSKILHRENFAVFDNILIKNWNAII